ncbi:Uncharacterised protein [Enterobacter hormaechei]|nr:Uncharacterised protein [Enterobacter hormaechei]
MEKAKYRVLRLSHIHNNLWPEGSEIEYDGEPGSALEPINAAAKAAKEKADQKRGIVPVDSHPEPQDEDEAALRQQYEELFNKKPGNMNVETIKERIAEERQKLGV